MAINIVDQFQVNTYLPIDNRFVVGTASMSTTTGTYSPFYLYRDDILYKYPGLRIWDFNDGVPYVWTGSTWSNENTTGALVESAGGHQNWIPKFKNNFTLLGKSLMFDNGDNIYLGSPSLTNFPTGVTGGIHVKGWVKTDTGFVGDGLLIDNLNASNVESGLLEIQYIRPNLAVANYVLTSNGGNNSWQNINDINPVIQGINLGGGANIFAGLSSSQYQFRTLTSTGLQIFQNLDSGPDAYTINLESKPGINIGNSSGIDLYAGLDINKVHNFRKIVSNTLKVSLETTTNTNDTLQIELPQSGGSSGLYINNSYIPTYDDWKRAYDLQQNAVSGRYLDSNGYYRGDGTSARPFTNSILYTLNSPNTPPTYIANSAIQNGLDFYINEFGTIPGRSDKNPEYASEAITIERSGIDYRFDGNFTINGLVLKINSGVYIICTTNGYLVNLDRDSTDSTSPFGYNYTGTNTYVKITIDKDSTIELRGDTSGETTGLPQGNGKKGLSFNIPITAACKGFKNSGSSQLTQNYSEKLKQILLLGEGDIISYYRSIESSAYSASGITFANNLYIFNGGFTTDTSPNDYNNSSYDTTRILKNNNDGHICIQVECNIFARNQGILNMSGNAKIEFANCQITSGTLVNNDFNLSGDEDTSTPNSLPKAYFHTSDVFNMSGGLIRFYNVKFFLSSGKRKNGFSLRPVPTWQNKSEDNGSFNNSNNYYGGSKPELRIVNCEFAGQMVNLFNKNYAGIANLIVTGCRTNYFICDEIFETYTNSSLSPASITNPPSDNWLGWGIANNSSTYSPTFIIDNRWGHQYDASKTWPGDSNSIGRSETYYNGVIIFSGNNIDSGGGGGNSCKINYNKVDLSNQGNTGQSNIINGNINIVYPSNGAYISTDNINIVPNGALNGDSDPGGYFGRPRGTYFLFIDYNDNNAVQVLDAGKMYFVDFNVSNQFTNPSTEIPTMLNLGNNITYLNAAGVQFSVGVIPGTSTPAIARGKIFIAGNKPTSPASYSKKIFRPVELKYRP